MAIGTPTASGSNAGSGSNKAVTATMPTITAPGVAVMQIFIPDTATTMTTPPSGWTPVSNDNDGTLQSWLYKRATTAADSGAAVSAGLSANNRWVVNILNVPGASDLDVSTPWQETTADTTLSVPGITPGVSSALWAAIVGIRYTATSGAVTAPASWTEGVDQVSANATAPFQGGWVGWKQLSGSGAQSATTGTFSQVARNIGYGITFAPASTTAIAVDAGAAAAPAAGALVTLSAVESAGSGTVTSRAWTQSAGSPTVALTADPSDGRRASYVAPVRLSSSALTFQYVATDANGTSATDTVVHTVKATPYAVGNGSGALTPARLGPTPSGSTPGDGGDGVTGFFNAFPGGGGQSCCDVSPFSADAVALGSDTGGMRFSVDGTRSSWINQLGLNGVRSKLSDGVKFSRVTQGVVFMTCGDGTAGAGGVYVASGAHTDNPSGWTRLDGVASGAPALRFSGGNNVAANPGAPTTVYPRHYGTILEVDDQSIPGFTLLHVASVVDGAWRIKVRNSDLVAVEQVQYAGTAGKYVRSLRLCAYEPNAAANDYSRLIINVYDGSSGGTPLKPLLCVNANAASGTLATATITAAPTNVENVGYVRSPVSGAVPLTVFVKDGGVFFSVNAHTAAAGSIAMTKVTGGPEDATTWISAGCTHQGGNHIVLVGSSNNPQRSGTKSVNSVWRGVIPASSSTPWNAVTWTAIAGPTHWSEQVLNRLGTKNLHWLAGTNAPGLYTSAAVSAITVAPTNPARLYVTARGNTFISDDYGNTWYESRTFGSASHFDLAFDEWVNRNNFATCTGDWPYAAATDGPGASTFDAEPHAVLRFSAGVAVSCWFDPKTGDAFIGGGTSGGHSVPAHSSSNRLWRMAPGDLQQTFDTTSALVDLTLNTGSGTSIAGVQCGVTAYGPSGTQRAIVVGTYNDGMFYTRNDGTNWIKIPAVSGTVQPFQGATTRFDNGVALYDQTRSVIYLFDREQATVWRCSVSTNGTVSSATSIFRKAWVFGSASQDGCGYIDIDEANDRVWVSTYDGIWYINGASMAGHVADISNATASGWNTRYGGEVPGPLAFLPATGRVVVATHGFDQDNPIYPINGCDGPRFLVVSSPTTPASWTRSSAQCDDWAETRDRGYRLGMAVPWDIARNWDGSIITVSQRGAGVGAWFA